ncbi:c-type cytochrome [Roseinatronobacter sp.]|uniref:c-type cytochrome n=1 Tax=Roseinatronobacter sp. TaxID=1945755 RepID=UPI0025D612A1|nr:c-type cytochrome [Rhodobaca sp.]
MSKMKSFVVAALMTVPFAAQAEPTGDAAAGEANFRQCASCHGIVDPDGTVIQRLAPTGPNLWGVVGRQAGAYEGYARFSSAIVAAGAEHDVVWDEETFVAYVDDPSGFLREVTGDSRARSNMNHRLRGSAEDIYAYLAQFSAD